MSDIQPNPVDLPSIDGDLQQLSSETMATMRSELEELRATGVEVTKLQILPGQSLRYHIRFPKEEPMWKARDRIETKLFDVGQTMQGGMLAFYATKRVSRSRGWSE